jgi:NAD(P)-dependent dehydrogenase (short-subunit alcohol dehydrogenase family)
MIFVTGGAGYIGTHTCVELLNAGHDVTVFDNFCNSQPEALARVQRTTGKQPTLVQGDIRDAAALEPGGIWAAEWWRSGPTLVNPTPRLSGMVFLNCGSSVPKVSPVFFLHTDWKTYCDAAQFYQKVRSHT